MLGYGARIIWLEYWRNLFCAPNPTYLTNDGEYKCEDCGKTVRRLPNKKGEPTPDDQLHIHHEPPIEARRAGRDPPYKLPAVRGYLTVSGNIN